MKNNLGDRLRRFAGKLLSLPAALVPASLLQETITRIVIRRARRMRPDAALRFMLDIDTRLYVEQGRQAVRYGNGVHTKHRHLRYHDFFVDRVRPGENVLDIGCGIGALAYDVAERSEADVTGVDYNAKNLEQARRQFSHDRVKYELADVEKNKLDVPCDVVILSNVLEHLPNRSVFLRQVVESTGAQRFLIRVPVFERDWRVPLKRELGIEWRLDDDHETEYLPEQFKREALDAGLSLAHFEVRWGEIWAELHVNQGVLADAA